MINGIGSIGGLGEVGKRIDEVSNDKSTVDFGKMLKRSIDELNVTQKDSEKAMTDIATGQVRDLHQAALTIDKAELSMKVMLEVRNKALSAYKEISRIQM
jgi:flagellar hook-basal body complex protein FliE